ncbi:beta-lactamase-like protein [Obelidium mucronatum]|nr:beta-lactamase-like protein [Obelidium mucronatum]
MNEIHEFLTLGFWKMWKIGLAVATAALIRFGPTREQVFMALANSPIGYYVFRYGLKDKTTPHCRTETTTTATGLEIIPVPYGSDNYGYILYDPSTDSAVLLDAADATTFTAKLRSRSSSAKITGILTTHHHWDHSAGNLTLTKGLNPSVPVYGSYIDFPVNGFINYFWHRVNKQVDHLETIRIGNIQVKAILVPCHTRGSLIYLLDMGPEKKNGDGSETARYAAFTGDALFVGGCGRFFEGSSKDMYKLVQTLHSNLPKGTVLFPGHEYSKTNLKFALDYEPGNEALQAAYQDAVAKAESRTANIPSLFANELLYNPYLRIQMSKKNGELWQKVVRKAVSHPSLKGKMEVTLNVSNGIFGGATDLSKDAETEVLGALRKLKDDY